MEDKPREAKPYLFTYVTKDGPHVPSSIDLSKVRELFTIVHPCDLDLDHTVAHKVKGILTNPQADKELQHLKFVDRFPSLKGIVTLSTGTDIIDRAMCVRRRLRVGYLGNVITKATADMGMALLLASARDVITGMEKLRRTGSNNAAQSAGQEVHGSTLGIVGLGKIGTEVVRRARGFDMTVLYHGPNRKSAGVESELAVTFCPTLDELLSRSDFVMLTCPLTSSTRHMIAKREFQMMKKNATLVNIARGGVVDHDALLEALQTFRIRGAALDVTDPEPLPPDHPLWLCPNLIVTAHVGIFTESTLRKSVEVTVDNLRAIILENRPLPADRELSL